MNNEHHDAALIDRCLTKSIGVCTVPVNRINFARHPYARAASHTRSWKWPSGNIPLLASSALFAMIRVIDPLPTTVSVRISPSNIFQAVFLTYSPLCCASLSFSLLKASSCENEHCATLSRGHVLLEMLPTHEYRNHDQLQSDGPTFTPAFHFCSSIRLTCVPSLMQGTFPASAFALHSAGQ